MISKYNTRNIIILVIALVFIANLGLPIKRSYAQIPVIDAANLAANVTTAGMTTAQKIVYYLKEFLLRPLIRKLANALENLVVNKMTSLISGQSQKSPSFIVNWRNFTLDSMARGNDVFRAELNDTKLCPYFSDNLRKSFGADLVQAGAIAAANTKDSKGNVVYTNKTSVPGTPSFQVTAGCTLASSFNATTFKNDFSKGGGWTSWNKLIEPQNNFFGAYIKSLDESQNQIGIDTQSSINSAIAGNGYLGQKLGTVGLVGSSPGGCVGTTARTNRCLFVGKEVTPAKLIESINGTAIGAKISRAGFGTELTDVIQSLIGAVITGLTSKLTNFIGQANYDAIIINAGNQINPPPDFDPSDASATNETTGTTATSDAQATCIRSCNNAYDACIGGATKKTCAPNPQAAGCSNDYQQCLTISPPAICLATEATCIKANPDICTEEVDPGLQINCNSDRTSCQNSCSTTP